MIEYTNFYNEKMIRLLEECVKEIEGGNLDKVDEFNAKNGPVDVKYVRASFNPSRKSLKLIDNIYFHGFWEGHSYGGVDAENPVVKVTLTIPRSTIKKIEFRSNDCEEEFRGFMLPILQYVLNKDTIDSGWESLPANPNQAANPIQRQKDAALLLPPTPTPVSENRPSIRKIVEELYSQIETLRILVNNTDTRRQGRGKR